MKKLNLWKILIALIILGGITNIVGILAASKFFGSNLAMVDGHFDGRGILLIMIWGLVYFAVAAALCHQSVRYPIRYLLLVLAIEKLAYAGFWLDWMVTNSNQLEQIYEVSWLTGLFFCSYGPIDFFFCLVFGATFVCLTRAGEQK